MRFGPLSRHQMSKPLNRAFALTFALTTIIWMAWQMVKAFEEGQIPVDIHPVIVVLFIYSTLMVGYPIIVLGLLWEVRRPTLDFRLDRNWRWLAAGAFLLGIFVLVNVVMGTMEGQTLGNWLLDSLVMETSSFALLFGILFMTRSTPQRSPSYRVILIGAVLFEALVPLLSYATAAVGIYYGGPLAYRNFWTEAVPMLWFWWDLTSELVIFGGALWLLRKGKRQHPHM